eukprot:s574_g9.t1
MPPWFNPGQMQHERASALVASCIPQGKKPGTRKTCARWRRSRMRRWHSDRAQSEKVDAADNLSDRDGGIAQVHSTFQPADKCPVQPYGDSKNPLIEAEAKCSELQQELEELWLEKQHLQAEIHNLEADKEQLLLQGVEREARLQYVEECMEALAADCSKMEESCEELQRKNDMLHAWLEQKTVWVEQAAQPQILDICGDLYDESEELGLAEMPCAPPKSDCGDDSDSETSEHLEQLIYVNDGVLAEGPVPKSQWKLPPSVLWLTAKEGVEASAKELELLCKLMGATEEESKDFVEKAPKCQGKLPQSVLWLTAKLGEEVESTNETASSAKEKGACEPLLKSDCNQEREAIQTTEVAQFADERRLSRTLHSNGAESEEEDDADDLADRDGGIAEAETRTKVQEARRESLETTLCPEIFLNVLGFLPVTEVLEYNLQAVSRSFSSREVWMTHLFNLMDFDSFQPVTGIPPLGCIA